MELNEIFHAFETLVAIAQFLDLLVLFLEVKLDGARLNLRRAIVVAQVTVEALAPAENTAVLCQRQTKSAAQASILDGDLVIKG